MVASGGAGAGGTSGGMGAAGSVGADGMVDINAVPGAASPGPVDQVHSSNVWEVVGKGTAPGAPGEPVLNTISAVSPLQMMEKEDAPDADPKKAAWVSKADSVADSGNVDLPDAGVKTPEQSAPQAQANPQDNTVKPADDDIFGGQDTDEPIKPVVPEKIKSQFVQVGSKFYYRKQTDAVAFEDKGNKLETESDSKNIASSLVAIAAARGWEEIKVTGSDDFKREIWLEASIKGIAVRGYKPRDEDLAELAARAPENKVEKAERDFRGGEKKPVGEDIKADAENGHPEDQDKEAVLVSHGRAKYEHDKNNDWSYYVTTKNESGEEKTVWGIDLKRALEESGAKVGDHIDVQNLGKQAVVIQEKIRDKDGNVVGTEPKEAYRNTWKVDVAKSFVNDSQDAAIKKHPELAGAYAFMAAAEKHADALSPEEKKVVIDRVKNNIANNLEKGVTPQVKVVEEIEVEVSKPIQKEKDLSL